MKIAILAAMAKEVELLKNLALPDVVVVKTGIGKVNAALTTLETIQIYQPDLIINSGVAGGLEPSLHIGDMVCGARVCYHDVWCGAPNANGQVQDLPLFYEADKTLVKCFKGIARTGLIISGDQFIQGQEQLVRLKKDFPEALAVDMESAAVAQTCHIYQKPFVCLRLISDVPGHTHQQAEYDSFWQSAAQNSVEKLYSAILELIKTDAG